MTNKEIKDWLNNNGFFVTDIRLEMAKLCIKQGMTDAAEIASKHTPTVSRRKPLSEFPTDVQLELVSEERGEIIAASVIAKAILNARDKIK